jgi:hypothetical protein
MQSSVVSNLRFYCSIIAIHGFDGHRIRSWTGQNGTLWLRYFLPGVVPEARVLTYGYNSYTREERSLSGQKIYQHGEDLITCIAAERQAQRIHDRPIIFIAHSLGGLVLKSVCVLLVLVPSIVSHLLGSHLRCGLP